MFACNFYIAVTFVVIISSTDLWPPFCPERCSCSVNCTSSLSESPRLTVDCSEQHLRTLPQNLPPGTQRLVLINNRIKLASFFGLPLSGLTELDLSINHLYELDGNVLSNPHLQYLILDGNQLDFLDRLVFITTPALRHLSLSHNVLEILHSDAFIGLVHLQKLDLSSNKIFSLDRHLFRNLISLDTLLLSSNNIHVLRALTFTHLVSLRHLDLSNNHISHIYSNAFFGLTKLTNLTLADNQLHHVPTEALSHLSSLLHVDLSRTRIVQIRPFSFTNNLLASIRLNNISTLILIAKEAFCDLRELTTVEIRGNSKLQYIDKHAFSNVPKLSVLRLSDNNLTAIEETLISSLTVPVLLSVHKNPLVCDCSLKWLMDELLFHTRNLTFESDDGILCSEPLEYRGQHLTSKITHSVKPICPPRVIPLFAESYNVVLGDTINLACVALGIPQPASQWIKSHQRTAAHGLQAELVEQDESWRNSPTGMSVLNIDFVQGYDDGEYNCFANNSVGNSSLLTHIRVDNMDASVIVMDHTRNSMTVTWKNVRSDKDFVILFKQIDLNASYGRVSIKPYMRTHTIGNISQAKQYELCLAVVHNTQLVIINCTITMSRRLPEGQWNKTTLITIVFVVSVVTLLITVAGSRYVYKRRWKRSKSKAEIYGERYTSLFRQSGGGRQMIETTTFENQTAALFDDDDLD